MKMHPAYYVLNKMTKNFLLNGLFIHKNWMQILQTNLLQNFLPLELRVSDHAMNKTYITRQNFEKGNKITRLTILIIFWYNM